MASLYLSGSPFHLRRCVQLVVSLSGSRPGLSSRRAWSQWRRRRLPVPLLSAQTQCRAHYSSTGASDARTELIRALQDLSDIAPNLANQPRLQLALQGLRMSPGHEAIRIAVLAPPTPSGGAVARARAMAAASRLVRLLLADPLTTEEQEWEGLLIAAADSPEQPPVLVRVGAPESEDRAFVSASTSDSAAVREMRISCPALNDSRLEILIMVTAATADPVAPQELDVKESVLVPMVPVPPSSSSSSSSSSSPSSEAGDLSRVIRTPVHQTLVIAAGPLEAAQLGTLLPAVQTPAQADSILAAIDLPGYQPATTTDGNESCPGPATTLQTIDMEAATRALALFRESAQNGTLYEKLWHQSKVPRLAEWLRHGLGPPLAAGTTTKPAVRRLVESVLDGIVAQTQQTPNPTLRKQVEAEEAAVTAWAQAAHEELRTQLDAAFAGPAWRRLRWWTLFLRADDVAAVGYDLIDYHFLPRAHEELIYVAGRIDAFAQRQPPPPPPTWPSHLSQARAYLRDQTVPALQALAQRLVMRTVASSGLAASLAGLLYASAAVTSPFDLGAVIALGLAWALRSQQVRWGAARRFWESEVREAGRRAVRAAELSFGATLDAAARPGLSTPAHIDDAIQRARDALARLG